jgi:ferredoxin--NADP+ reductase
MRARVSVNAIMLDGIGICGVWRVTIGGDMRFAYVDGPSFDGHEVDIDEFISRLKIFEKKEKTALEEYNRTKCIQNTSKILMSYLEIE